MTFGSIPSAFPSLRLSDWDEKARERAAIWSMYFHRFADPREGHSEVPISVRPLSRRDATDVLVAKKSPALHRYGHVLATGYEPHPEQRDQVFQAAGEVAGLRTDSAHHTVRNHLVALANGRYRPGPDTKVRRVPIDGEMVAVGGKNAITLPTVVTYVQGQCTITTKTLLPLDLDEVRKYVEPKNWVLLGPFFERTDPEGTNGLHERFVYDWNDVRFDTFDVHLQIDYTPTADVVRADYALIHEVTDKIVVDDGYVDARRVVGAPDWTLYTGSKSVRYRAGYMNVLAPAIMMMFLESHPDWILQAIKR